MVAKKAAENIWMITREYGNLAGAGGLRDMVRQLSVELTRQGEHPVSVVMPLYGFMDARKLGFSALMDPASPERRLEYSVDMNFAHDQRRERVLVWEGEDSGVKIYGIESERFTQKLDVYTYTAEDEKLEAWKKQGDGHYDYFALNILLQKAAMDLIMLLGEVPDIIHCHDGHTAVLPAMINELAGYRNYFRQTATVVTIHNAGYGYHQEVDDLPFAQTVTDLSWATIQDCLLEGKFDPFIAASKYAAMVTVSENYARELRETDADAETGWLGHTLLSRGVRLGGITNGTDPGEYNPGEPQKMGIASGYDVVNDHVLKGKEVCKKHLLQLLDGSNSLNVQQAGYIYGGSAAPLFTFVGRLNRQKGVDVMLDALPLFFTESPGARVVVLGSGNKEFEEHLMAMAGEKRFAGKLCFLRGFDPALANTIYAAGDFFLIPSRFEPCGLTDYIAQLFGNIPVVHSVGGLVKVRDGETGYSYSINLPGTLAAVMHLCVKDFADKKKMRKIQQQAVELIEKKYSWQKVVKAYSELYDQTMQQHTSTGMIIV